MIVKVVVNSAANITYDITQFQVYWLINIPKKVRLISVLAREQRTTICDKKIKIQLQILQF